ncbi:hypothetical protein LC653_40525 [Nostoc sp. CHAB 5784]|uniref:hypothetical protein n=1 Tax=Nostoc mirabile TaxID=2907820 RepID=UPI001E2B589D|nr:hypothetical protein [Nostoc mirabile]MCC5669928.1 hypothetical protein [Nostoc mirabile CHAB5784]
MKKFCQFFAEFFNLAFSPLCRASCFKSLNRKGALASLCLCGSFLSKFGASLYRIGIITRFSKCNGVPGVGDRTSTTQSNV